MTRFLFFFLLVPTLSYAVYFQLPQLDPSNMSALNQTFTSTFLFRPAEGPAHTGRWSVSVGATGKFASTAQLVTAFGGTATYLPMAEVFLGIQMPFALTLEAGYLPSFSFSGATLSSLGGALKWSLSRALYKKAPLEIALRALASTSGVNYTQPLAGGTVTVDYKTTAYGAQLQVGKTLGWFEPYAGAGYIFYNATITGTGSVSLFNGNFPPLTTSNTQSGANLWLQAGLNIQVFHFLILNSEYDYVLGASSFLFKFGFKI